MVAAVLMGTSATAYAVAAWSVKPGFYDGTRPTPTYRWDSPPPGITNGSKAEAGHCVIQPAGGQTPAGVCATSDAQAVLSYVPGAFDAGASNLPITLDLQPVADFPTPKDFTPATNVYLIQSSARIIKPVVLELSYSDLVPAPADIYLAAARAATWQKLGSAPVPASYTLSQQIPSLGYVTAGSRESGWLGGKLIPIVVAVLIAIVLLGGAPLAIARRRHAAESPDA